MILRTKYQGPMLSGLREDDFLYFSCMSLCQTCDPRAGPVLTQEAYLKYTRYFYIPNIKALGSRHEDVFMFFSNISICKTFDTGAGRVVSSLRDII